MIFGVWVSKCHPDALLAKTMGMLELGEVCLTCACSICISIVHDALNKLDDGRHVFRYPGDDGGRDDLQGGHVVKEVLLIHLSQVAMRDVDLQYSENIAERYIPLIRNPIDTACVCAPRVTRCRLGKYW